jgi:hypothetical protein
MAKSKTALAESPSTPRETLLRIAQESTELAELVAKNPSCDAEFLEVLHALIESDPWGSSGGSAVLSNINAGRALIERIIAETPSLFRGESGSDYPLTREVTPLLAKHPNTPSTALEILADSGYYLVRELVAARNDLPRTLLEKLSQDDNAFVRKNIASNVTTGPEVLAILAEDSCEFVRFAIANNPSSPASARVVLALDNCAAVRLAAHARGTSGISK